MDKRCVIAALLAIVAGSASVRSAYAKDPPKINDARRCPRFSQRTAPDRKAVVFVLENKCDASISCSVNWSTRCDKGERVPRNEEAIVAGKSAHEFDAASGCSELQSWEVGSLSWQCNPVN